MSKRLLETSAPTNNESTDMENTLPCNASAKAQATVREKTMANGHKLPMMASIEGRDVHTLAQAEAAAAAPTRNLPSAERRFKNQDTRAGVGVLHPFTKQATFA